MSRFLYASGLAFVALLVTLMVFPSAQLLPAEEVSLYWFVASLIGAWALPRLDALVEKMRPMGATAPANDEQVLDFGDDDEDEIEFVEVLNV